MRSRRGIAAVMMSVALVASAPMAARGATGQAVPSQPSVAGLRSSGGATVLGETWLDARTVDLRVSAPMVRATPVPVRVVLPVGWSATSGTTYPVVFLLHGGNGDYTSWTRNVDVQGVTAGYDAIVVMADAGRNATYTNYLHPYNGDPLQWMTFHTRELPQIIERGYHANRSWGIAGISSGGYGSFAYATQNPGMFRYAAEFSGPIAIRLPLVRTLLMVSAGDSDPYARWGVPLLDERNWSRKDPLSSAANLRGTGLYLSSGTTGLPNTAIGDGPWGVQQVGEFYAGLFGHTYADRLRQLGIPATTSFYPLGEHNWPSWRREFSVALPLMMHAIGAHRR